MRLAVSVLLAAALSGCLLASGQQVSSDTQPQTGNISASFVSAEGSRDQEIATGIPGNLDVIAIVTASQGTLQIDVIDGNGAVQLSVQSRPNETITRSGTVSTNATGTLRYRVSAQGARDGSYQLLYQRRENATETPQR